MELRQVSLVYLNGRTHDTGLYVSDEFVTGFEFELCRRRWRVEGPGRGRRAEHLMCTIVGAADTAPAKAAKTAKSGADPFDPRSN
jgi:hypothetical protein